MILNTTRFGKLEIEPEKVIEMPDGMVGFGERSFVLLNPGEGVPFYWFQSTESPNLAFVVTEPTRFVPGYEVKLTREEYDKLHLEPGDEIILLAVVTMSPDPRNVTINLQGPIVVNPVRLIARQLVLDWSSTIRYPLVAAPGKAPVGTEPFRDLPLVTPPSLGVSLAMACV